MIFVFKLFEWSRGNKHFMLTISFDGNDYFGWHDYVGVRFLDDKKTIRYDRFRRFGSCFHNDYLAYLHTLSNHPSAARKFEDMINHKIDILSLPLINII